MNDALVVLGVLRDLSWLVVVCYAGYKIARMFGRFKTGHRMVEAAVAGFGGAVIWWSRVLAGFEVNGEVVLSLVVIGLALIAFPKLLNVASSDLR